MKKLFKSFIAFLMLLGLTFSMASCGETPSTSTDSTSSGTEILPPSTEDIGFTIHFNKNDKDVTGKYAYNLWLWAQNADGADYQFNGEDDYGAYAQYKYGDIKGLAGQPLGFIVKTNKPWSAGPTKDVDMDRFINFDEFKNDSKGYKHVYLVSKDPLIYSTPDLKVLDEIKFFRFEYVPNNENLFLFFKVSKEMSNFTIKKGNEVVVDKESANSNNNVMLNTKTSLSYRLPTFPNLDDDYTLSVTFKESGETLTTKIDKKAMFATPQFDEKYKYDGELGAIYTQGSTTFKVWSPISSKIILRVYDNGTPKSVNSSKGDDTHKDYEMTKDEKGVFSKTVNGDLEGKYYTYVVTNEYHKEKEIVDPYAKSCGVNGLRGMIVDFSKTNPSGWNEVKLHDYSSTQLTVYETHIADLTSHDSWGGTKTNAKKFNGFYEEGTTYTKDGITVKTGFDHIKELGVNAVQLLPIFDSANDEVNTQFNWGYNPLNYNALDGSFASDPYDGYTRIKEFKSLVSAYNKAGINIIMDVVYNHVNGLANSNFDVLMPGYYFRYNNGQPSNGSGCGNETASDHYMFAKFMKDSTEFWAKEYKLGGFRFDLMGIHDTDSMNALVDNLHKNVNKSITVYGEPWAGGATALSGKTPATQINMDEYKGYGCFNDQIRDGLIKGGLCGKTEKGWITDSSSVGPADVTAIKNGMKGLILPGHEIDPLKTVNYATCHDNYTLHDRIKASGTKDEATIKKMAMLANSVVFTSQGITFMLAGEEFLRSKNGNSNSYNASYGLNALDYNLKIKHLDMFKNYQKLIALKQNKNLFGKDAQGCKDIDIKTSTNGSLIYFDITDTETNETYRIIHKNGVSDDTKVDLEGYTLYLDTLNKEDLVLSKQTVIDNYQTIIAKKAN